MSMQDRSDFWTKQRAKRMETLQQEREEELMKDCTFEPICYSRVPLAYQHYSTIQLKRASILGASVYGLNQPSVYGVNQPSVFALQSPSLYGLGAPSVFGMSKLGSVFEDGKEPGRSA